MATIKVDSSLAEIINLCMNGKTGTAINYLRKLNPSAPAMSDLNTDILEIELKARRAMKQAIEEFLNK